MIWTITEKETGMIIRDFLIKQCLFSRRILKAIKQDGCILLNGKKVTVREQLHMGDQLKVIFPEEEKGLELYPKAVPLDIIYEDDAILVINKQRGIPVIPSRHYNKETIAHGLLYYYEEKGLHYTVHVVTRLDRNTSGLMLVAKHRYSHSLLSKLQRDGEVKRAYTAFVEGEMLKKKGTINVPIGRNPQSIVERMVREDGQRAITHYEVVEKYETFSVVKVLLETGRTHQIRVHFSYLGHPLVGDDLYGGSTEKLKRQGLHCDTLSFYHPFSHEWMEFTIDLPEDMREFKSSNRN